MSAPKGIRRGTQASLANHYAKLAADDPAKLLEAARAVAAPPMNQLRAMFTRDGEQPTDAEALAAFVASAGLIRRVTAVRGC